VPAAIERRYPRWPLIDLLRISHKPFSEGAFWASTHRICALPESTARPSMSSAVREDRGDRLCLGLGGLLQRTPDPKALETERRHAPTIWPRCISGDCWVGLTYYAADRTPPLP